MIDFNATNTSVFLVSMATVSDSRMGPFSNEVESVIGEDVFITFHPMVHAFPTAAMYLIHC